MKTKEAQTEYNAWLDPEVILETVEALIRLVEDRHDLEADAALSCAVDQAEFLAQGLKWAIADGTIEICGKIELTDAAQELMRVIDSYPEQLVPINRESVTCKMLRTAIASAKL